MYTNREEVKERLEEIQVLLKECHMERESHLWGLALKLGNDVRVEMSKEKIIEWAMQIQELNEEMQDLADERRELRTRKKELSPVCPCGCHG